MSAKYFSKEEQGILAQNPFTKSVTNKNLYTTKEFKEKFLERYLHGDKSPTQIIAELGYDPQILGYDRISGIRLHIMEKYKSGEALEDGGYSQKIKRMPSTPAVPPNASSGKDAIYQLRTEVCYTSRKFIDIVKDIGLRQSMSRRGNCWDNAPQESFFGHMKDEIDLSKCILFEEVKAIIDDWMNYYNNDRYQWKLAKLSPNEYYRYITSGEYPLGCMQSQYQSKNAETSS